jgi:hypothetical protein
MLELVSVKGGGSSWAVTLLHAMIGLTGYRTRDLLRNEIKLFTTIPVKTGCCLWPPPVLSLTMLDLEA